MRVLDIYGMLGATELFFSPYVKKGIAGCELLVAGWNSKFKIGNLKLPTKLIACTTYIVNFNFYKKNS